MTTPPRSLAVEDVAAWLFDMTHPFHAGPLPSHSRVVRDDMAKAARAVLSLIEAEREAVVRERDSLRALLGEANVLLAEFSHIVNDCRDRRDVPIGCRVVHALDESTRLRPTIDAALVAKGAKSNG